MRTLGLLLLSFCIGAAARAQTIISVQGGMTKPFISESISEHVPGSEVDIRTFPGLLAGASIISDKNGPVNFGGGFFVTENIVHSYMRVKGYDGTRITHMNCRNLSLGFYPVIDLSVGKNKYFHLLISPTFQFVLSGTENGYRKMPDGRVFEYNNAKEGLKDLVLGFNSQVQLRYPVSKHIGTLTSIGYSLSNTTDKYISTGSGSAFFQLGLSYKIPATQLSNNKEIP